MKKIFALLCIIGALMAVGLTGCGDHNPFENGNNHNCPDCPDGVCPN